LYSFILPWRNEKADLLGGYQTARESLLAKRDQLQFLNAEHGSFADEFQRAVQQLSILQQNQFGDNLYGPLAPSTIHNRLEIVERAVALIHCMMERSILIPVSICTVMVSVIWVTMSGTVLRHQCLMIKMQTSSLEEQ